MTFIVTVDGVDQPGIPTPRLIESANEIATAPAWYLAAPYGQRGVEGVWYLDDGRPPKPDDAPVVRVNIRYEERP